MLGLLYVLTNGLLRYKVRNSPHLPYPPYLTVSYSSSLSTPASNRYILVNLLISLLISHSAALFAHELEISSIFTLNPKRPKNAQNTLIKLSNSLLLDKKILRMNKMNLLRKKNKSSDDYSC